MASIFGHALTAFAISKPLGRKYYTTKLALIGMLCSIIPDADVIGFQFGIAYKSFWGHRGFTHSFVFACILAIVTVILFFKNQHKKEKFIIGFYLFLCTASHGLLDILTDGGKGVALLAPFDNTRYFSPFRPIKVSPIGITNFFSSWGLQVIISELLWIGLPSLTIIFIANTIRKSHTK